MAEQLAQGDGLFAGSGKFGPVARDRGIQLQLAFGHQLQRGDGGKGLGAGEQIGDGVAVPGLGPVLVGSAGPQIEDGFAADLDAQRCATLLGIVEQRRERLSHRFELKLVMTLNLHPQLPGLTLYKVAGIVPALEGFGNRIGPGGCGEGACPRWSA
ncbi:hypothetical protein D3C81_1571890 [compost metagenome]